jgi:hypothetical protein
VREEAVSPEERLRAALAKLPPWIGALDSAAEDRPHWVGGWHGKNCTWTITPSADSEGWETDSGAEGYGLPEDIAKAIVDVVNSAREMLAVSDSTA